ncbi:uncharacterized protein LOC62_04G006221 [Vanrija pseudolonga]|uniref:Uncharacterized protein n=1 Tax=Vanrija pseudolonga TaxID=143232 RepID=A0AAF1BLX1_9TREE|nr:hypothetical protein LOC62_04G006221 [Vanrija pseudolonga]
MPAIRTHQSSVHQNEGSHVEQSSNAPMDLDSNDSPVDAVSVTAPTAGATDASTTVWICFSQLSRSIKGFTHFKQLLHSRIRVPILNIVKWYRTLAYVQFQYAVTHSKAHPISIQHAKNVVELMDGTTLHGPNPIRVQWQCTEGERVAAGGLAIPQRFPPGISYQQGDRRWTRTQPPRSFYDLASQEPVEATEEDQEELSLNGL